MAVRRPNETSRKLRRLRNEQGLTMRSVAERSGISATKISDIENGRARPSVIDVRRITDALDLRDEVRNAIIETVSGPRLQLEEAGGWMASNQAQKISAEMEEDVRFVKAYTTMAVPSWMQTVEYMTSVHDYWRLVTPLPEWVAARLKRQSTMAERKTTVQLVIKEAALRADYIDSYVAQQQLGALLRRRHLPNVRIGIDICASFHPEVVIVGQELVGHDFNNWTMVSRQYSTIRSLTQQFDAVAEQVLWDEDGEAVIKESLRRLEFEAS